VPPAVTFLSLTGGKNTPFVTDRALVRVLMTCLCSFHRESDYGVVTREFEAYADECLVSVVFTVPGEATAQPMILDATDEAMTALNA
jgi:hypothetical protein